MDLGQPLGSSPESDVAGWAPPWPPTRTLSAASGGGSAANLAGMPLGAGGALLSEPVLAGGVGLPGPPGGAAAVLPRLLPQQPPPPPGGLPAVFSRQGSRAWGEPREASIQEEQQQQQEEEAQGQGQRAAGTEGTEGAAADASEARRRSLSQERQLKEALEHQMAMQRELQGALEVGQVLAFCGWQKCTLLGPGAQQEASGHANQPASGSSVG